MSKPNSSIASPDFLVRGSEWIKGESEGAADFKLIGRETELANFFNTLMKKSKNNLVIYGQPGVGTTAILKGVQASKGDPNTPYEIVGKKFFVLDTDALFSTQDGRAINDGFNKAMATLSRHTGAVLMIDDTKDFLNGVRNSGTNNLMNILMRNVRAGKFQIVFETREADIPQLLESHSDMAEYFTFQEVYEPKDKHELRAMVDGMLPSLETFHNVKISKEAVDTAIDLGMKYPGITLNTAQPTRAIVLLEEALTEYRQRAHTRAPGMDDLEQTLADIAAYEKSKEAKGSIKGKTAEEIAALALTTEQQITEATQKWAALQKEVYQLHRAQRDAEEEVEAYDDRILAIQEEQKAIHLKQVELDNTEDPGVRARIIEEVKAEFAVVLNPTSKEILEARAQNPSMEDPFAGGNFDGEAVTKLRNEQRQFVAAAADAKKNFDAKTQEINKGMVLTAEHVLNKFSVISGLPINKLNEDATQKLLKLDENLMKRVYGQDEVVNTISNYVRNGSLGLKPENKPIGNFFFIGPTGVGKTELTKALAAELMGTENAINRFDMGGFQEKNTVNTLVGSPRGYEGYADGGLLTNAVRKKPNSINLFDEVEKAHKDVYDLLLPVFDEGILADTRGMVATFGGTINIMTSNLGAKYFQDPQYTYDQAKEMAMADVKAHFRPEFLARIDGIYFFKSLEIEQIEKIAKKELRYLNGYIAKRNLTVEMDDDNVAAMVAVHNNKELGGRGIRRYIDTVVKSLVSNAIMEQKAEDGVIRVTFNQESQKPEAKFESNATLRATQGGNKMTMNPGT